MVKKISKYLVFAVVVFLLTASLLGCCASQQTDTGTTASREPIRQTVATTSATTTATTTVPSEYVDTETTTSTQQNVSITKKPTRTTQTYAQTNTSITTTTTTSPKGPHPLSNGTWPVIGEDVMPIGAWVAPPSENSRGGNPNYITDENFRILSESGINIIYSLYEYLAQDEEAVFETLRLCEKYGIYYFPRATVDTLLDTAYDQFVEIAKYPAFAGLKIADEPGTRSFDALGAQVENFEYLFPDKYFYVNLLPMGATASQLEFGAGYPGNISSMDYDTYLDQFVEKLRPRFLSFDNYPLKDNKSIYSNYYENISIIRAKALKEGIPWWTFIQATKLWKNSPLNETDIQWLVNTQLAYGAQGIQWFCYWTPLQSGGVVGENFVTETGEINDMYYYGQRVNKQIAAVDEVLMHCTSKGVIVSGKTPAPVPASDCLASYGVLQNVTYTGDGYLTGCFDHEGKDAYYVVNNSRATDGTVTLHFNKAVSGKWVKDAQATSFSGTTLTLTLKKGEGALVYF